MATFCAKSGKMVAGTHTIAELNNITLTFDNAPTPTPKFLDTYLAKKHCGFVDVKGSGKGSWDMTDTLGQKVIHDANVGGTTVALKFYIDATKNYSFNAFITTQNIVLDASGNNVATFDFNFEADGAVTLTLA